jgi:serine phosphatase RsbU (regulator of sigma subunit)
VLQLQAVSGSAANVLGDQHSVVLGEGLPGRIGMEGVPLITVLGCPEATAAPGYHFAGYPLISGDELVGVLGVLSTDALEPVTVAPLHAMAHQIAVGIRQSWLLQRMATVAEALQKPLLPPTLPTVAGLDLAARYQAHGDGTRIGGDFYDVFALADGRHVMVLGDVCGKGPEAAAVTGLVRHTIWTAAQHRPEADYVLPLVNQALLRTGDARFCTLTYGLLDRVDEAGVTVHLTCAGHPPPVISRPAETRLSSARGTLLGVTRRLRLQPETVRLNPGDTLVCYTDGLTEGAGSHEQRRPADIADDVAAITLQQTASATVIADALLARTRQQLGTSLRDDLATLVIAVPNAH